MLADLLGVEVTARRERYLTTRTRLAHLPFRCTLEEFDFGFQPSIDERQVKELAALAFVAEANNLLLLGPPGVGKTHLAVALAFRSIENGYGAYFVRAYDILIQTTGTLEFGIRSSTKMDNIKTLHLEIRVGFVIGLPPDATAVLLT